MAKHTPSGAPLQAWVPGGDDEAAFGSWPASNPSPAPPAPSPAPRPAPTSRRARLHAVEPPLRGSWWDRFRYAAADVLVAGVLSNRLVDASAAAEAPVTTGRRIVVLGAVDGSWTSTVSVLLARIFGQLRKEPALAVDFSGSLELLRYAGAEDAPPFSQAAAAPAARHARSLAELLGPESSCGNNVFALASAPAAFVSAPAGQGGPPPWSTASSLFSRFAAVTIVDAGASPQSPETAALLRTVHAAVVVSPDDAAGDQSEAALRRAIRRDFPELPLITVWTGSQRLAEAGGELVLPYDHHLSAGGAIRLDRLGAHTRVAATEIAGAVLTAANRK